MNSDKLRIAKLFEYVVAVLLHRNGYRAGVPQKLLQGRGTKHQIDVLAIDPLPMPFVFPTRILAEAKCYSDNSEKTLGVSYVRNLFAEVTDLQQTLPRQKKICLESSYDEPVSCVYSGAIFSTIGFSKPAIEFANSYAISLVPLPNEIEKTQLKILAKKLSHFVDQPPRSPSMIAGCPNDCFSDLSIPPRELARVLKSAGQDVFSLKDANDRRMFVYALDAMMRKCSIMSDFNKLLSIHRIASIGNILVLAEISEPEFRALAKRLAEHFLGRSNGGFDNFVTVGLPPDDNRGRPSHGGVAPGELTLPDKRTGKIQPGFERFGLHVLGADLSILASRGTRKQIANSSFPNYFTMMLDYGLVLHVRILR